MKVAIIDYGSGNLRSATKAFERASRESGVGADIILTDKAEIVAQADRIVLPGVGAYADCKAGLAAVPGMIEALREGVEVKARPFLGICVGTGADGLHAYFVHSYHLAASDPDDVLAVTDYGGPVTAAVARDNRVGTQFHPEKSQALGLALIANFLRWKP